MQHQHLSQILTSLDIVKGQVRKDAALKSVGWYTATGLSLGWGDLTVMDLLNIQINLAGDVFVIVSEDLHWQITDARRTAPSPAPNSTLAEFLTDHAERFVTSEGFHSVTLGATGSSEDVGGLAFAHVTRAEASYQFGANHEAA